VLLVRELVQNIQVKLREAGLSGAQLEETTAAIAFSVVSTLDDNAGIEIEGTAVHPYLTFRTGDAELTHCGENSYLHEFVYEVLQAVFQKSP
jgi:hypothetical protein